jgi:hypothetical protein
MEGPDHAGADRVREDGHIHAAHSAEAAEQPPGRAVFLRLRALANEVGLIYQLLRLGATYQYLIWSVRGCLSES